VNIQPDSILEARVHAISILLTNIDLRVAGGPLSADVYYPLWDTLTQNAQNVLPGQPWEPTVGAFRILNFADMNIVKAFGEPARVLSIYELAGSLSGRDGTITDSYGTLLVRNAHNNPFAGASEHFVPAS
jgi:hypothetical protein